MSSDTEDSGGLGKCAFAVRTHCFPSTIFQRRKRKKGTPLKRWSYQIINDTGLPLFAPRRYAVNRTGCRGTTSRRTARGATSRRTARGATSRRTARCATSRRKARGATSRKIARGATSRRTARGQPDVCV